LLPPILWLPPAFRHGAYVDDQLDASPAYEFRKRFRREGPVTDGEELKWNLELTRSRGRRDVWDSSGGFMPALKVIG